MDDVSPLIVARWRRPVVAVIALAALLVVVLSAIVWHGSSTSFDNWAFRELVRHVDGGQRYRALQYSGPMFTTGLLGVVVVAALAARRWHLLALTVVGPLLALVVTEAVLKPLVERQLGLHVLGHARFAAVAGSFPSGHETSVASAAVVLAVALAQLRPARPVCWLAGIVLTAWAAVAAIGLVRSFYHYATDIVGAIGVSAAVVLGTAFAIDAATSRLVSSPDVPDLPRTSRAV